MATKKPIRRKAAAKTAAKSRNRKSKAAAVPNGAPLQTDFALFGVDMFGERIDPMRSGVLAQKFIFPPFSILDARTGVWQDRKRAWIDAVGIRGEMGRGNNLIGHSPYTQDLHYYRDENRKGVISSKRQRGKGKKSGAVFGGGNSPEVAEPGLNFYRNRKNKGLGHNAIPGFAKAGKDSVFRGNASGYQEKYKAQQQQQGGRKKRRNMDEHDSTGRLNYINNERYGRSEMAATSVFDPVLCELMYRWFCPPAGAILDPFAGESTKGIVAACLGYDYTGVELRPEQIEANRQQLANLKLDRQPEWLLGDSSKLDTILPANEQYDFVWTSPPYYDLEIYSESNSDGSAKQTYEEFISWYRAIFKLAVARLRPNRFAAVKVGEIRDKQGAYRDFIGDNVQCFRDLGLVYYNEAILITAAGSLPIRTNLLFNSGRKLGKSHQNILIFYKGNPKHIKKHFLGLE